RSLLLLQRSFLYFSFHPPPPTDFSPLSLHDALPIFFFLDRSFRSCSMSLFSRTKLSPMKSAPISTPRATSVKSFLVSEGRFTCTDRKSTRLNSSHVAISYAVFCLKKKNSR